MTSVVLAVSFLTSCSGTLSLQIQAGPLINPLGADSRILEFRVYQLKTFVDVNRLNWNKMTTDGGDREQLQSALTDPAHPDGIIKDSVQQDEVRVRPPFQRLDGTRYLLLVTSGRKQTASSIRLAELSRFQKTISLCFAYYDIFEGEHCERYLRGERR